MSKVDVRSVIDEIYRVHSRRVFASLVRTTRDFDMAEDALHEAFRAAVEQWPRTGVPHNPVSWLISAGRFKAIDGIRKQARLDPLGEREIAVELSSEEDLGAVEDERLRLIFTCCHPALRPDAQVALTLREVCGLTTEEIAYAFFTPTPTLAQRIVRAKGKIRDAGIPYAIPEAEDLPDRLESVLRVIYLVFNEGYSASSGEHAMRTDLAAEAIRLARLVAVLLPEPEVEGLLALMLLHESRRRARTTPDGDLIPLEEQNRFLWDRELIWEGAELVEKCLRSRRFGPYSLQAAISAVHATSISYAETDWAEIAGLYQALLAIQPWPVVELNMAVAVAMRDGPAEGLRLIDSLIERGELGSYHFAHAARGDLYDKLGDCERAKASFELALSLAQQTPERRFLARRLSEVGQQRLSSSLSI
jgi:RNA polymerase sigma-70 factor (ECF subfamily)